MTFHRIGIAIVQIAFALVVAVVAFLAYAGITTHRASANAADLCKKVHIGQDARSAEATLLGGAGDFVIGGMSSGELGIGYKGAFVEKWFCHVSFVDGRVSKVETIHLD
jgi:hypothetical protein